MKTIFSKFIFTSLLLTSSYSLFAHVVLDNPKGGETFVSGSTVTVTWHITITHVTLNWDLLFSPDGGATWDYIQEDIPAGALSYDWHVPNNVTSQARVTIIQDNQGTDYQDESDNFTIQSATTSVPAIAGADVKIYPNPVSDFLTIDIDQAESLPLQINLVDATGRTVWLIKNQTSTVYLPVASFLAGLYFLQIESPQGIIIRKIIITKP